MRTSSLYAALVAVSFIGLPTTTAHAHPSETSFRLGLGVPLVSVEHYPAPEETAVTYGLYPTTLGLHVGVQIVSEVGLAVHLLGGGAYDTSPAENLHYVIFSAAPRFEYMFTPHETVAPYLGVEVGVRIDGYPDVADMRDVFWTGGLFGLHIFAETELSFDLELAPGFVYDVDRDVAGFRGVLAFSMTGWLR